MSTRSVITANQIVAWASRREAQELLPVLLRRLVFATGQGLERVGFPARESVQQGGWDGIVTATDSDTYVPAGMSAWELSTTERARAKAKEDYDKRTKAPGDVTPSGSTLLLVTAQRFSRKTAWIAARSGQGVWADVRLYDADDLEQWLERAPAVASWFADLLGLRIDDAWELGSFWSDWSETTHPPLSPELVLAGRSAAAESIAQWWKGGAPTLTVVGASREEALAVIGASVEKLPADERDAIQSRTLVVNSDGAWQRMTRFDAPLTLIPAADGLELGAARKRGHRVVMPTTGTVAGGMGIVHVGRLSSRGVREALVTAGVPERRAEELGALARRSLFALRRALDETGILAPAWHREERRRLLIPLLLLERWNEECAADRGVVETLAGAPYADVQDLLLRLQTSGDPPARRIGSSWRAVSLEELWEELAPLLTEGALERYTDVAVAILTQPDTQFALDWTERLTASWNGDPNGTEHSSLLQEGVAGALAFIGARGTAFPPGASSAADFVRRVVYRAFERMPGHLPVAVALMEHLTDLVEAAPDDVLRAIDSDLRSTEPTLAGLFRDTRDPMLYSSPHTGLLWGLERLAWSPSFVSAASMHLARLARLDPGGQLSNRPANSLTDIFRLWQPATAASLDARLLALDRIRAEEPRVAWPLLTSLLPSVHGSAILKSPPQWRDWAGDGYRVITRAEYWKGVEAIVGRVLQDVGALGDRWEPVLEALGQLTQPLVEQVLTQLESLPIDSTTDEAREAISASLRSLLSRHRSIDDPSNRLPDEVLDRLSRLLGELTPTSLARRHAWLFTWFPDLADGREDDIDSRQKSVEAAQANAVKEVAANGGLSALLQCAALAPEPRMVGSATGRVAPLADESHWLGACLTSLTASEARFAGGYIEGRFSTSGWEWVDSLLSATDNNWTSQEIAALLGCLPHGGNAWARASQRGGDVERAYWTGISPFGLARADEHELAARNLLLFGRPVAAVELLGIYAGDKAGPPDYELLASALEAALGSEVEEKPALASYNYQVARILDVLSKPGVIDEVRLAGLEWSYMPLFRFGRRTPAVLFRELGRRPGFFVELVAMVYRAEGEEPRQLDKGELRRATVAGDLLREWRQPPGLGAEDAPDSLVDWIIEARRLLAEALRTKIGDEVLGQLLSGSAAGTDGVWPHERVREVIEMIQSESLEHGLAIGVYNSRGVFTKSVEEGGNAERAIAERYERHAIVASAQSHRTAAVLRSIAETYRRDARREDLDSEVQGDG